MKLFIDPGHGGSDPGAKGNGLVEKEINLDIALRIAALLADIKDIQIRLSRDKDTTKSLSERTDEANAWGADFYLSIHCNSFNGHARGYEDFIYDGISNSSITAAYQQIFHSEIIKKNNLLDRGQKKANYHVLRETMMPALLTENGFIDHPLDSASMKETIWRQDVAEGHVRGLIKAFHLQTNTPDTPSISPHHEKSGELKRIIAGSFSSRVPAERQIGNLRSMGIQAFISVENMTEQTIFHVQAGTFSSNQNAQALLKMLKNAGYHEAFIR
ncbi:N-acetylmuramoyl-L-alanine amidase [Bacillus dakarensis]|uniref:N-acetylmuramoyl-L-alanine amidase n=1 Tax=Robertmurraya dakarensis TaxID=1926278 RepID=UPI000980A3E2|nr:N-acetylmuramoyl-L-alanine amidase [Bacillus dakarensis]